MKVSETFWVTNLHRGTICLKITSAKSLQLSEIDKIGEIVAIQKPKEP
jgi:hypothetical protein